MEGRRWAEVRRTLTPDDVMRAGACEGVVKRVAHEHVVTSISVREAARIARESRELSPQEADELIAKASNRDGYGAEEFIKSEAFPGDGYGYGPQGAVFGPGFKCDGYSANDVGFISLGQQSDGIGNRDL